MTRITAAFLVLAGAHVVWAQSAPSPPTTIRRPLRADTTADGIPCAATGRLSAEFHPSGRLAWCPLARDFTIAGHAFTRETWISLTDDGHLSRAWLDRSTVLDAHRCRGTGYKGWSVVFHPGGRLKTCFLVDVEEIDGIPCERGTFWNELTGTTQIVLREDGTLAECKAARAITHGGAQLRKGERIRLP